MCDFVQIKTCDFDFEKHKELIEVIENYAVGSILVGKEVKCEVINSRFNEGSEIRYLVNNNGQYSQFKFTIVLNKPKKHSFYINFNDKTFRSSGFKGFFTRENYKYLLSRSRDNFSYTIEVERDKYLEQTKRLMKLFRRYL